MPNVGEVLTHAWQIHQSGNVDAAMQLYRGVLDQVPDSAEAWVYLGIAQFDVRDFDGSVSSYRKALSIKSHFPIAWNNLGNSLRMLGQVEEAETCFETSLQQQPDYLSALKNRGTLWVWNGDVERGLRWYQRGLEIDPNNAELHRNLGVISLLMGDFKRGFDEFRWRWRMPGIARPAISAWWQSAGIHVPVWSGQPLSGCKVVIYPEQGLGDAIHFIRVASSLKRSGAQVIVVCHPRMMPLLEGAPGVDRIVADHDNNGVVDPDLMQADFQGSFLEMLDGLFQRDNKIHYREDLFTESLDKPSRMKGYLRASNELVARWQDWLNASVAFGGAKPIIGINWQGNREHHADVYRSVPLEIFRPLVQCNQFRIVNLQFGDGIEQLEQSDFGEKILRLPATLDQDAGQFMDTAAVLCNLDAVVTTDTAIAHLAGAVGVRTHLLLGRVPDWRWQLDKDATSWYPNTVLTRQTEFGNWDDPIAKMIDSLQLEFNL